MILKVHIHAKHPFLLPFNYLELLNGYIYTTLQKHDQKLFELYHDNKLRIDKKPFKPFVFSNLFFKSKQLFASHGILAEGKGTWYISSSDSKFLSIVQCELLKNHLKIGNVILPIEKVEIYKPKTKTNLFVTLSPVCVSYKKNDKRTLLLGHDQEFILQLKKNLMKKIRFLYDTELSLTDFDLRIITTKEDGVLFDYKNRKLKGEQMIFEVSADNPIYLEIIKNTMLTLGIGNFNSMGCGFVLPLKLKKGGV